MKKLYLDYRTYKKKKKNPSFLAEKIHHKCFREPDLKIQ